MKRLRRTRRGGFSLLEVVIVVAIIAILAAIGIPRMSRGSKGAGDSALSGDLAVLRNAIDLYAAEHGGALPTSNIATELTQYTTALGAVSPTKTTTAIQNTTVNRSLILRASGPAGSREVWGRSEPQAARTSMSAAVRPMRRRRRRARLRSWEW